MNESCWICLALPACVPARRLLKLGLPPRHAALAQSRVTAHLHHRPHSQHQHGATQRRFLLQRDHQQGKPGTELTGLSPSSRGGRSSYERGLTLQFRHQLLPQPNPPPPYPILTNTTTAPLLLLPMPLSSAAPLTSLASIWIEAPCFSSYKSR